MKKQVVGFAILLVALLLSGQIYGPARARDCMGGPYEGREALAQECLHQRQAMARQINRARVDRWICITWMGQAVCYDDIQMCVQETGECNYRGNWEDYCRWYRNC